MNLQLKNVILKSGLKQRYIAEQIKIDHVTFSKKLNGYLHFTKDEKAAIAKKFSVSINDIFPK